MLQIQLLTINAIVEFKKFDVSCLMGDPLKSLKTLKCRVWYVHVTKYVSLLILIITRV